MTGGLLLQSLLGDGNRWVLLALVAVQSGGFAMSRRPPAARSCRGCCRSQLVPAANTLTFTMSNLGTVLGPLIAGVVLVRAGYALAYGIDAVLFTAGLYAAVRLPSVPPLGRASPGRACARWSTGCASSAAGRCC